MNKPRKTTRKVNTSKIKELFRNSGKSFDELADAIGKVSSRTLRRMAEEKDVRISKPALDSVQEHFNVSLNELYIPDDDQISSNHVILNEIRSLSNLFENKSYRDLRNHHGHRNIRTFKHYDLEIGLHTATPIQNLINTALSKDSLLNGYGHTEEDIKKEMEYIEKLGEGNESLRNLRLRGVYLYYGNYKFKGIEEKFLNNKQITDKDIIDQFTGDISDEKQVELWTSDDGKLIPSEIKVEIFYFKQFGENYTVPSKYKIFPNLGYTEKQLTDVYLQAMKRNKLSENEINLTKKWLQQVSKLNWYIKDKVNNKNDDDILWYDRYLPSDFYIDYSSENYNFFKFFTRDADSYNGNFEKVQDTPSAKRLKFNVASGVFIEETYDVDAERKEMEDAMKT